MMINVYYDREEENSPPRLRQRTTDNNACEKAFGHAKSWEKKLEQTIKYFTVSTSIWWKIS